MAQCVNSPMLPVLHATAAHCGEVIQYEILMRSLLHLAGPRCECAMLFCYGYVHFQGHGLLSGNTVRRPPSLILISDEIDSGVELIAVEVSMPEMGIAVESQHWDWEALPCTRFRTSRQDCSGSGQRCHTEILWHTIKLLHPGTHCMQFHPPGLPLLHPFPLQAVLG